MDRMKLHRPFFLWLLVCSSVVTAFNIIDYPCPVDPPCDCDGRNINCDSRGLSVVPRFNLTNGTHWYLYLNNNSIPFIQSQAFVNLKGMEYLNLADNKIESIAVDALMGSENSVIFLHLRNNKLRTLPSILSKMKALISLNVDGNPLQTLDTTILRALGSTLQYLTFGSPEITQWPTGVQYLTNLTDLTVRNCPIEQWPSYAFLGLSKVTLFSIENCMLRAIPITLNMMSSLDVLSLNSNPYLPIFGIPNVAFSGMSSISMIDIRNQNYNTLPNIFYDAINLHIIEISMTPITYIPASLFPDDTPITQINLNGTMLNHIPDAFAKMKKLQQIVISYSNITSISSNHFKGFTSLISFNIFNSHLSEVADDAFSDMDSLQFLFLESANLTTIPKALLQLKNPQNLRVVGFENNRIICNCESLGWLKEWEGTTTVPIMGSCANIHMDLGSYIVQEVPKCLLFSTNNIN